MSLSDHSSGPVPHAQLVAEFSLDVNNIQLPVLGTNSITATAGALVRDAQSGDQVNSVVITSAHATANNGSIVIRNATPPNTQSDFTWTYGTTLQPQVLTFTCVFTVNYTIDSVTMEHSFTRTENLEVIAEPEHYWFGTISQSVFDGRAALTNAAIESLLTRQDNFTSPETLDYTGAAAPTNVYAALYLGGGTTITEARVEGLISTFVSVTPADGSGRRLWIVDDPVSAGTHSVEWRT